jgi:hypothetical protein
MLDGIDRWENEGGRGPSPAEAGTGFDSYLPQRGPAIQRLPFVADAARADVDRGASPAPSCTTPTGRPS